jgi:hypothetical protein
LRATLARRFADWRQKPGPAQESGAVISHITNCAATRAVVYWQLAGKAGHQRAAEI